MMNPSAILQMPIGVGSPDMARIAGRQTPSETNAGAFADLLAKVKAAMAAGPDATSAVAGEGDQAPEGERLLEFLKGSSDLPNAESGLGSQDLAALMQGMGGRTVTASDIAALVARLTQGSATEASETMGAAVAAQDRPVTSPEQAVLRALAKLSGRDAAPVQEEEAIAAVLTLLGRETHLGPAQIGAASSVHSQWAAEVAQQARQAAQAAANGKPPDATPTAALRTDQPNYGAQLAAPGLVVTAAEEAGLGANFGEGGSAHTDGQVSADALVAPQAPTVAVPADVLPTGGATASVTQQIADHIVSEASTLTPAGRPDIPTFVRHESPMKVLSIQLQPADLGTVTIRISVKDNTLRLDLEAGRGETVRLIQRDQDTLSTMLRSAGYLIDGMEVRLTDQVSAGGQPSMGQAGGQPQGGQSGSPQQDTRSWSERHSREQSHNPFSQRGHGDDEQAARTAGRGGVYI
jgi:chemotaxis protein MotD